jgi:hypothetical protein
MLRIGKRREEYFAVAQAALLEAKHRKSIGSPGEKRHSGSNPIGHFLTAEGFMDSVPVEMACFELAGAAGREPAASQN